MNVATFAQRITGTIGIDAATANSASSNEYSLFLSWLNEAVEQFLMETRIYVKTGAADFTANQWEYDIDDDILEWIDFWIVPDSGGNNIQPKRTTASEIIRMRNLASASQQESPVYIAARGWNTILVYPTPTSSDALHFMYVPKPTSSLAATADTPSATAYGGIPSQFHPVLEAYVKWKAADYDDDTSSQVGLSYQAEWEKGVQKAKLEINKRMGPELPPMRWGRRKWPLSASPGVDLG